MAKKEEIIDEVIEEVEPEEIKEEPKEEVIEEVEEVKEVPQIVPDKVYILKIGLYDSESFADIVVADFKRKGFNAIKEKQGDNFLVHCGKYTLLKNVEHTYFKLKAQGYKPEIV